MFLIARDASRWVVQLEYRGAPEMWVKSHPAILTSKAIRETQKYLLLMGEPQTRGNHNMKNPHKNVATVSHAAGLAGRAIARLEAAAEAVHAQANGGRGFQAVSSKDGFAATIRHGKTLIEIQNDSFAVRQVD
jgi:hypothetical protein